MPASPPPGYAELHALSAFSFRRSAAQPQALVRRAAERGYAALAITDECSMAGVVRAHEAVREHGVHLIIGSEFHLDSLHLVLLAPDRAAYAQICRLITRARRRAGKGEYRLEVTDLDEGLENVLVIWKPARQTGKSSPNPVVPAEEPGPRTFDGGTAWMRDATRCEIPDNRFAISGTTERANQPTSEPANETLAAWLKQRFGNRLWLGASRLLVPGEREWLRELERLGERHGIPRLACGDVRLAVREDKPLLDVFTALRMGRPVAECGLALAASGEQHLRGREVLAKLYPGEWLSETLRLAERCAFSLDELNYRYPRELVPQPLSPIQHLRQLTLEGARKRYGKTVPETVQALLSRELALIEAMGVEAFFLTVHDLVVFARSRGILCQGRGSAANSAVCYCLGVTEVDPSKQQLLFERFLSKERNEPPDIDVDFEHERREEVLQYVYEKYGRERAALAATVICYRPRSAMQDVGRALGFEPERINRLTASLAWWDQPEVWPERLRENGLDPDAALTKHLLELTDRLIGFPRHLSQHVGGMVISDTPLYELVPVENAAMADRTIIQWDKDDLETLGLLKVDCLALGMLTVIRKAMELVNSKHQIPSTKLQTNSNDRNSNVQNQPTSEPANQRTKEPPEEPTKPRKLTLAAIPREDAQTYDMLCRGDAVGVFQVESRAQMAMLPRLKPRCFYDLVIEVAIVRPGPIQGDMVHPYLERRRNPDAVAYPSPELKTVLERTLGVPIFQEQVMQIAMVAAGFSAGEADQLRRAMAAWRRRGGLEPFRERLLEGMGERGYSDEFAERIYRQICGFGEYGFPESHAASFALLTYVSSWLKCHHPAAFACALLNSQPMGFYAPAQIINDVKRHGVRVLPVDVRYSDWDCTLTGKHQAPNTKSQTNSKFECSNDQNQPTSKPANQQTTQPAVRLGFRMIKGFREDVAERIAHARSESPFRDVDELTERAGLDRAALRKLADAGALKGLAGHRHRARWAALGARRQGDLLAGTEIHDKPVQLTLPDARSELIDDYASLGLSLERHPLKLLRRRLGRQTLRANELPQQADGRRLSAAGLVTHRQRPGTASGVVFLSLEDETGIINVVVWPKLLERYRREVLGGRILRVHGKLQNVEGVCHLVAERIDCLDDWLAELDSRSRDFC
ncbi:error-prone DNA polymerase [Wenzhouxiangella sp. XN201]|uniref:error-prone DNA polymerase n=1 Tax=Wenzhouxiangella sp. XN201 TaxID=2710755 RepID=UPI0013C93CDC|nr:error-prone DNA polymerase [Wenzhouxiangella sp. XN201]NEZ03853.1 error-prone DNA polymerase [Wenzhouxiangella sp. XN201]